MEKELVVVIDFGGQYNQLVARRVRECNVYCEIYSYKTDLNKIKAMNPKGIILTGGPASCYEPGAATCSEDLFHLGVPVLGLCYGAQLMTHVLGGKVERAAVLLDEPFRLYFEAGTRLPCRSYHRKLPCGSSRVRRAWTVCDPVPSGSTPHGGRLQDAV